MIRQYPEVPAAVELADVARHIMNIEFRFIDSSFDNAWHWQSTQEFDLPLRILVAREHAKQNSGRLLFRVATLGIVENGSEYFLDVPIVKAPNIKNDPYIEDFVDAFRQYEHGRTELVIPGVDN